MAERELRAAQAESERANSAKSRFLAAASHDLRQPLAALQLYVDVLQDRLTAEHQPIVLNMQECVAGLSDLLSKLLDLSKLEAGVVKPQPRGFTLDGMFNMLHAAHAPEAEAKGLRLRWRCGGQSAHTDPVLFQRLAGNLIANAIQYTARGGVLIGCRRREGRLWVEIWDTGIGIPADKTSEIFEEFKQLGDDARTRGSGLGLTIVAKTAALLGLQIRVQSRPGRGSLFAVELPPARPAHAPPPPAPRIPCRNLRIAVVDDNPIVLNALAVSLESAGHEVLSASSGAHLLARLGSRPPDVMVCDYRLAGGETGFDVITLVRAAFGSELPAIITTGDTDPRLMRSMAEQGIIIQHKPVQLDALQARMEEAMRGAASAAVL
jgi:CheY-like chemotaxis protein